MEGENIDPVYKYVDDKLKLIERGLKQELLKTQRNIAAFIITSTAENIILTVRRRNIQNVENFVNQLIASASSAKTKVDTSKNPLSVSNEFYGKCY